MFSPEIENVVVFGLVYKLKVLVVKSVSVATWILCLPMGHCGRMAAPRPVSVEMTQVKLIVNGLSANADKMVAALGLSSAGLFTASEILPWPASLLANTRTK